MGTPGAGPRILCAPDKLRSALSAPAAARALADGVRAGGGDPIELAIADGGEGTLDAFLAGGRARAHTVAVHDALGRERAARLGELDERTFLVEAAEAIPLAGVGEEERDVLAAGSAGVGELVAAALDRGARRILLALGGTATVDGGAGALHALGGRCARDGGGLLADRQVDLGPLDPRLRGVGLEVLADVRAPLCGPEGAAHRFGAQKGASAAQRDALDAALADWAQALGIDPATPGAGAAGGLGAAFMALGARTLPGAEAVLDLVGFDAALAGADLCLTAEGSVDGSTLLGKAVAAVVARCAAARTPVVVLGGRVEPDAARALVRAGAQDVRALGPPDRPLATALAGAAGDLREAARDATRAACSRARRGGS